MKHYGTRPADIVADRAMILSLWGIGLAREQAEAKLDYFYGANPEGLPVVTFLTHGEDSVPVGIASACPRRFRWGETVVHGAAMIDFFVAKEHRTFFPALFLQKEMKENLRQSREIAYGLPNRQSLSVFRRLGFAFIGNSVRRAIVLRSAGYLSRYVPDWFGSLCGAILDRALIGTTMLRVRANGAFLGKWNDRPDARYDDLWSRFDPGMVVTGIRDRAFLAWRFAQRPGHRYRFFALQCAAKDRLAAYAVCERQEQTLHVRDFLADEAMPGALAQLWLNLVLEAFREGCTSVSAEFLGSARIHRVLADCGFLSRGGSPVHMAVISGRDLPRGPEGWYLTYADIDD
jgi:hypothetical protein